MLQCHCWFTLCSNKLSSVLNTPKSKKDYESVQNLEREIIFPYINMACIDEVSSGKLHCLQEVSGLYDCGHLNNEHRPIIAVIYN